MEWIDDWPWRYWAARQPDSVALYVDGVAISWQQLVTQIDQLSDSFWQQGVREGSGIALQGENSEELLLCYLAALQLGARVLVLNPRLAESVRHELLPGLTLSFGWGKQELLWDSSINILLAEKGEGEAAVSWQPNRMATMILTSGSTGLPKAVVHTLSAHLYSAKGVLQILPLQQDECWSLSLPLFHVSGQGILWRWLYRGAKLSLSTSREITKLLQGCTHASLVPTQLWRLLREQEIPAQLKSVLLGGAMIPVELVAEAIKKGINCWCGYGMTEMASTVTAKYADGQSGVGWPLADRQLQLHKEEIWVRGACLAEGYWWQGELHRITNEQGWFPTNDRGGWQEGELLVQGRLDNLFFRGGEAIQPEALERILLQNPLIKQVIIVPVPDQEYGHSPVAVVAVEEEGALLQLQEWGERMLTGLQRPVRYYLFPPSLLTEGVKISRQCVQQWVLQQWH